LPAERVVRSLNQIIEWRGQPQAIRVDNGGVSETLCMRLSPCGFDGSFIEPFWV
jgi:hypothetical protein